MLLPAASDLPASVEEEEVLFLLPGGRPRRFGAAAFIADIQAGGRPRRLPRPRANLSRLIIASSICSRSCLNSARIFDTSIMRPQLDFRTVLPVRSGFGTDAAGSADRTSAFLLQIQGKFKRFVLKSEQEMWAPGGRERKGGYQSPRGHFQNITNGVFSNENKRVIRGK